MKFEVMHGNDEDSYYTIVEAGSDLQACMFALQQRLRETDTFSLAPFCVTNLDTGTTRSIKLAKVMHFRTLAAETVSDEEIQRLEKCNEEYHLQLQQEQI